jgi:hypothetical protein
MMAALQEAPRARPTFNHCHVVRARFREVVIPPGIYYNLNLRTFHDALYGPPRAGDVITFIVMPGAVFLSRSAKLHALRTGRWPGGRS